MNRRLEDTAHHEAGYAVAAVEFRRPFRYVTIDSGDDSLGHVMFRTFRRHSIPNVTGICARACAAKTTRSYLLPDRSRARALAGARHGAARMAIAAMRSRCWTTCPADPRKPTPIRRGSSRARERSSVASIIGRRLRPLRASCWRSPRANGGSRQKRFARFAASRCARVHGPASRPRAYPY
jgi:hypothetical protein